MNYRTLHKSKDGHLLEVFFVILQVASTSSSLLLPRVGIKTPTEFVGASSAKNPCKEDTCGHFSILGHFKVQPWFLWFSPRTCLDEDMVAE